MSHDSTNQPPSPRVSRYSFRAAKKWVCDVAKKHPEIVVGLGTLGYAWGTNSFNGSFVWKGLESVIVFSLPAASFAALRVASGDARSAFVNSFPVVRSALREASLEFQTSPSSKLQAFGGAVRAFSQGAWQAYFAKRDAKKAEYVKTKVLVTDSPEERAAKRKAKDTLKAERKKAGVIKTNAVKVFAITFAAVGAGWYWGVPAAAKYLASDDGLGVGDRLIERVAYASDKAKGEAHPQEIHDFEKKYPYILGKHKATRKGAMFSSAHMGRKGSNGKIESARDSTVVGQEYDIRVDNQSSGSVMLKIPGRPGKPARTVWVERKDFTL